MRSNKILKDNIELIDKLNKIVPRNGAGKSLKEFSENLWDDEKVRKLGTAEIIKKLRSMNIEFNLEQFKEQTTQYICAISLAEGHYYTQNHSAQGKDEDFIWIAICELWKRFFPQRWNIEMIDDCMQDGYEEIKNKNYEEGIIKWETAWDMIKYIVPARITSVSGADAFMPEPLTQSIYNWCQDFETELYNAGVKEKGYLKKLIKYCREFCERFYGTEGLIIQNMLRAEAESYLLLGDRVLADELFEGIIKKFPDSVWGYVGWADTYTLDDLYGRKFIDHGRAEKIYKLGLIRCKEEKDVIYERLESLCKRVKKTAGYDLTD
ncbi:MAG: hypothetical protein ABH836_04315 [Candidatus Omnitrophota bacterium]